MAPEPRTHGPIRGDEMRRLVGLLGLLLVVAGIALFAIGLTRTISGATDCIAAVNEATCGANWGFAIGGGVAAFVVGTMILSLKGPVMSAARSRRISRTGLAGTAEVIGLRDTGTSVNENPMVRINVRVMPDDGSAPFDSVAEAIVSRIAIPRPGDRLLVRYDPADRSQVALIRGDLVSPPTLAAAGVLGGAYGTASPGAAPANAGGLPGMTPMGPTAGWTAAAPQQAWAPSPVSPATPQNPVAELERLDVLRRSGALTDEEFESLKRRVLG